TSLRKTPLSSQPQAKMNTGAAMNARMNRFMNSFTPKVYRVATTRANPLRRAFLYKRSMRRRWLVDRADDCASNRELNQVANNPTAEDLGRQGLYRESDQVSSGIYQRYKNRQRRAGAWATPRDKTCTK